MCEKKDQIYLDPYEDVTREDVLNAIDRGFTTLAEIKNYTRAGMGIDEGKICMRLIAEELSAHYDVPVASVMKPSFRPPLEPVLIGVLADAYYEECKEGADCQ